MRERRTAFRVYKGKPEGKRTLGRPRYMGDNIKMFLK
jgi:hypothetical protein